MKAPKGLGNVVEDMAERLRTAATTPALTVAQSVKTTPAPAEPAVEKSKTKPAASSKTTPAKRVKGAGAAVSVFLRVPIEKHAELEKEAVRRTKQAGKGVTIQQIILGKL